MSMNDDPILMSHYTAFTEFRRKYENSGSLNLNDRNFYYPTTLLPLINFIKENSINYVPHYNFNVNNYFSVMTNPKMRNLTGSYIPFVELPKENTDENDVIYELSQFISEPGELNAFGTVISELTDNIYEHACFEEDDVNGYVMAQRYKDFAEICILDNGLTIPRSIEQKYKIESDSQAIQKATQGFSTKEDKYEIEANTKKGRGTGLRDSIKLFTKGLNGEILIISRNGGFYIGNGRPIRYIMNRDYLEGTLISIRVPIPLRPYNTNDYFKE